MRWLILVLAAIPVAAAWATLVFYGTARGWWQEPLAEPGDTAAFAAAVAERLEAENRGNAAFRLLDDGRVAGEHYVWVGEPVNADSVFQVASVSKWIAAWGVMDLAERGELDLDAPVETYLSRWQLPDSPFDHDDVTVRRLLSHTAGLTDDLGYDGFAPGTPLQPLVESLDQAADAMPGSDGRVRVGLEPGSEWRYSGGGYTLLQLLIEEVSGLPFADYMDRRILEPLGMRDSTFEPEDVAAGALAVFYDTDGTPAPHYRFTARAAAGLYTSAADLTRFLQAQLPGPDGAPPGRGVLEPVTLEAMREPQATVLGTDIWGLGVMLYAPNGRGDFVIGHEGSNSPAINTSVRLDPDTGDGIVLLITGSETLASELGGEWVLWHTGRLDVASYARALDGIIFYIAVGWIVIALVVMVVGWRVTGSRTQRQTT